MGTGVELYDCNNVGGQHWVPQANGSLLNPASGYCLDSPNGATARRDRVAHLGMQWGSRSAVRPELTERQ
jgi:hypothetical protein